MLFKVDKHFLCCWGTILMIFPVSKRDWHGNLIAIGITGKMVLHAFSPSGLWLEVLYVENIKHRCSTMLEQDARRYW